MLHGRFQTKRQVEDICKKLQHALCCCIMFLTAVCVMFLILQVEMAKDEKYL